MLMTGHVARSRLIDVERLLPNDASQWDTTVADLGFPAVTIDNFYRDPEYVRDLALSLVYTRPRNKFPGFEASISLDMTAVGEAIRRVLGDAASECRDVRLFRRYRDNFVFSMAAPKSSSVALSIEQPHYDDMPSSGMTLAGLVYLNLPHQCRGGTALYTHRRTGLSIIPPGREGLGRLLARLGKRTREEFDELIYGSLETTPDGRAKHLTETWELRHLMAMRFNRLALYPSQAFHGLYVKPGDFGLLTDGETDAALEDRRLTHTMFLEAPL